jgi:hypothetical protein
MGATRRRRQQPGDILTPGRRARLLTLANAAAGCDWEDREVQALGAYFEEIRPLLPWSRSRGAIQWMRRSLGGDGDVGEFVSAMRAFAMEAD